MRRIAVVLGLVAGLVASAGFKCDAATFECYAGQSPANPPGCFCKADHAVCEDMGDCMTSCPVGGE